MEKTYNGWANWETWNFMLHEGDSIQISVQVGMSFEEVEDLVYTHISILAENEEMESLSDIAREFATAGFDSVDIHEIAEAVYENLKEDYELI